MDKQKIIKFAGIGFALLLFISFILFRFGSFYFVDYLWYASHSYTQVWEKQIKLEFLLYILGVAIASFFYMASYFTSLYRILHLNVSGVRVIHYLVIAFALFVLFTINGPMLNQLAETFVLALYAPDYGLNDPIYDRDASFYMFRLALYQGSLNYLKFTLVISFIISAISYFSTLYSENINSRYLELKKIIPLAIPQLSIIASLFIIVFSVDFYLGKYHLIYDGSSEKVAGASYIDVNARSHAYSIISYLGILFALVLAILGFWRRYNSLNYWKIPLATFGTWIIAYFIILRIYPGIVHFVSINPNEFLAEKTYIKHSIDYTREGYGLSNIKRRKFSPEGNLRLSDISNNQETINNIRLWDYRPIQATLSQLQEIRQYYEFADVDIDRYQLGDKVRQVMIAARELNKDSLPTRSKTWESRHLQYTHGYGLAMAPSNEVTDAGLPHLWIRDFPSLITKAGIPSVKRPEIYYGELNNDYVIVNTSLKEIDYPLEQNFAETVYQGKGGFKLGSGLRYLLIASEFDTSKFIISRYINDKSRILFRRNIHQAVRLVAPFLKYDSDPYLVLGKDGRLYWMMDAYTSSKRFPYSAAIDSDYMKVATQSTQERYLEQFYGVNYIRNSVKITIDAYDGTMSFYLVDPSDPIATAWSMFFPDLFKPLHEMPDFLQSHMRHAENLFLIQASIYSDYHMDDPRAFYNLEDRWQIANELYSGQSQKVEPYYTLIKLPGEKKEEYVLMLPFVPNNKENIIAWMGARCDYPLSKKTTAKDNKKLNKNNIKNDIKNDIIKKNPYGEIIVYDFPRSRQSYGPMQIESRIDQEPNISKDLTLWNQQGSRVIRGNLLTIPIANTLLYIEPIYLQSTNSPFPELRRVIVADNTNLVMGENLKDALLELSTKGTTKKDADKSNSELSANLNLKNIANKAQAVFLKVQNAAARGDWDAFGKNMAQLKKVLKQINK